ncbi:MAG: PAC2 family protein [Candidatus Omnitrophica bacterium]|nr:PAC2 family protein [Candidatus Omnitrophota bacterium]
MEQIKFLKRPRIKNPILIAAWPGMGEVAFKAASFLIEKLKANFFAELPSEHYFYLTESVVQSGIIDLPEQPVSRFYYVKTKQTEPDLIIFLSNAQPDLVRAEEYCLNIINLAKQFKVKKIVTFAAMPQPIDHLQQPAVWCAATSKDILEQLRKHNLNILSEGQISGLNGLFLGLAKKAGFQGFCLLGEIPLYTIQIENPKSSQAVIEVLCKIFGFEIDLTELAEQAHNIEQQISELLEQLKIAPTNAPGPIGEEEIEKIKKSLAQLTKLPVSIKEKIEQLFKEAQLDLSKALQLKAELDKWNVYKDYEDRFLDLFKKTGQKNN